MLPEECDQLKSKFMSASITKGLGGKGRKSGFYKYSRSLFTISLEGTSPLLPYKPIIEKISNDTPLLLLCKSQ